MCGIAGIIGPDIERYKEYMPSMLQSIVHRGPDDLNMHFFSECALGHVRLSIVDITNGRQPMLDEQRNLGLVFNGEIYGYKDIKKNFFEYPFHTDCDTEIILALYHKYGNKMLKQLPGMFAFALWDERNKTLFCARDRFGEKPFYYAVGRNGEFIFASEIKAILATGLIKPQINHEQLWQYLNYQYVYPTQTIYSNIHVLPPAHFLTYHDGKIEVQRYWKLPETNHHISEEEAVEEFQRLFRQAVKRQLIADVPVGAFLSGGLDSGTIVATAAEFVSPVTTISFGFKQGVNELDSARSMAKRYNTNHIEIQDVDFDIADLLFKMQEVYDEPMADPASIPAYLIAQHARQHVKVVLTGDAGDELLGGYDLRYRALAYMQNFHSSNISLKKYAQLLDWKIFSLRCLRKGKKYLGYDNSKLFLEGKALRELEVQRNAVFWAQQTDTNIVNMIRKNICMFSEKTMQALGVNQSFENKISSGFLGENSLDNALRLDLQEYLPGNGFVKTDRTTMACSLESRTPFCDIDLANFCISLPFEFKVNSQGDKYLLRKGFSDKWTNAVKNNVKNGFSPPFLKWLQEKKVVELKEYYLRDKNRRIFSVLAYDEVQRILCSKKQGVQTWNLLQLSMWLELHKCDL